MHSWDLGCNTLVGGDVGFQGLFVEKGNSSVNSAHEFQYHSTRVQSVGFIR